MDKVTYFCHSLCQNVALSYFHLSCMFIVNFTNLNTFCSCTMWCRVSWRRHCGTICLTVLVCQCQCIRIVYNTNTLFYKVCGRCFHTTICWLPMVWKISLSSACQILWEPNLGARPVLHIKYWLVKDNPPCIFKFKSLPPSREWC
jgi:hypothetical protein